MLLLNNSRAAAQQWRQSENNEFVCQRSQNNKALAHTSATNVKMSRLSEQRRWDSSHYLWVGCCSKGGRVFLTSLRCARSGKTSKRTDACEKEHKLWGGRYVAAVTRCENHSTHHVSHTHIKNAKCKTTDAAKTPRRKTSDESITVTNT